MKISIDKSKMHGWQLNISNSAEEYCKNGYSIPMGVVDGKKEVEIDAMYGTDISLGKLYRIPMNILTDESIDALMDEYPERFL